MRVHNITGIEELPKHDSASWPKKKSRSIPEDFEVSSPGRWSKCSQFIRSLESLPSSALSFRLVRCGERENATKTNSNELLSNNKLYE